jgi:hypothetical protein
VPSHHPAPLYNQLSSDPNLIPRRRISLIQLNGPPIVNSNPPPRIQITPLTTTGAVPCPRVLIGGSSSRREIACVFVVPNIFASTLSAVAYTPVSQTPVSNGRMSSCFLPLAPERKTVEALLTLGRGEPHGVCCFGSTVNRVLQRVGIKCLESSCCWLNDSGNAAIPATIPAIMNIRDMMDQITPQHCEEPPYFWAKTLASEVFTLRRMRSSHYPKTVVSAGREDGSVRLREISQCPRRCKGQT